MDNCLTFIEKYGSMIDAHLTLIKDFLSDKDIQSIGWEYNEAKNSQPENPFNVFTIASELYYRENFHSDIIKAFLDPIENHNEGTTFLYAFIDFINDNFKERVHISKQNYISAKVERETGKIDILISSEASKHCIVIENKMNNAVDMQRQLPRYYDHMTSMGYSIDAIVYLPLDANKRPDQSTWTETDKQHVLPLLCPVPAYQKKGVNLVNGWLEPCSLKTKNLDCVSVLRQYCELIKILSKNIMDNVILEKFYRSLLEDDNFQTAKSIRNMFNAIPAYMKDRMSEQLKASGCDNVWSWKPEHCGLRFFKEDKEFKIDIWSSENGYTIQVFCQSLPMSEVQWSDDLKNTLEQLQFHTIGERFENGNYSFLDEAKVIEDVKQLAEQLSNMLK